MSPSKSSEKQADIQGDVIVNKSKEADEPKVSSKTKDKMIIVDLTTVINSGIAALKKSKPSGFYYQDENFLKIIEDEINAHAALGERFCGLIHTHCTKTGCLMAFQPMQGKHSVRLIQIPDSLTKLESTIKVFESEGQLISSFLLQGFEPIYIFKQV
jgi:hypothetical protein